MSAARPGRSLGPLDGVPVALKDLFNQEGTETTAGSKILTGYSLALRRHRGGEAQGGRRGDPRQAQPRRVRDGQLEREQRIRAHVQPLGSDSHAGRQLWRLERGAGGPRVLRDARHRHGRFHSPACLALGCGRPQAHLRPRLALRRGGLRQLARSGGTAGAHGGRRRRALASDRRRRRSRLHLLASRGPRLPARPRRGRPRRAAGRAEGVLRRRHGSRGGGFGARRHRDLPPPRRGDLRGQPAAHRARGELLLSSGHRRGLFQPGPLRRREVRRPSEGREAACSRCTRAPAPRASATR